MRRPPFLMILALVLGLVLAACGGSPSESSPDDSSGGGGGEPSAPTVESEAPVESQAGGGGGGGGGIGGSGSVNFDITGSYSDSGELPYVGDFAYWQVAGVTFLVFTDDTAATEANGVILTLSEEGNIFQYVTDEMVIPAGECDWNITQNDATGASGSFTCNDQGGFGTDGTFHTDLDISGDFDVDN